MACAMCGSKKHSTSEHSRHAMLGRLKSSKWRAGNKRQGKSLKAWWKKNRKRMTEIRRRQVTTETRKKLKSQATKRWRDPVWRKRMCRIRKTQSKGNQIRQPNASFYRTMYAGPNGRFWMRSGWEVAFANWLDRCGIRWEYESRRFALERGEHYTPDFYLPDQREYVELKGWMTKKQEKKYRKFQALYPDVKLYMFFGGELKRAKVLPFRKVA